MKSYTQNEYEQKAIEANNSGQMLYIIRKLSDVVLSENDNITTTSSYYIDSLAVAPIGYYICMEDNITDGTINPNYEQELLEREQEKINNLHVTPLDFIKMLTAIGITSKQIDSFLNNNIEIKQQLTFCNHVYCGIVKSFAPFKIGTIEITAQQIEQLFIQFLRTN